MSLTVEMLHRLLVCDPEAGRLFWKARTPDLFRDTAGRTAAHACANWNANHAGTPALSAPSKVGYLRGNIFNVNQYAHRVIMAMQTERWPALEIDHINGDRTDNRLINLREVSHAENAKNRMVRPRIDGPTGVYQVPGGRWEARISDRGRNLYLGSFASMESAIARRQAAQADLGYHPNHGRAA